MANKTVIIISFSIISLLLITLSLIQTGYAVNTSKPFATNSTILPGYINCLIDYTTSQCKECPPNCITFKTDSFIIDNKDLASNLDKIYEKSLKQISIIKSSDQEINQTKTAIIYLQSLLLKNYIKPIELSMITDIFSAINQSNSTTTLAKNLHEKLEKLSAEKNPSPIAISILNITSKSVDLLINSDSIIHKIQDYPNLPYDIEEQRNWVNKVLSNTIVGCEISGVLGCLMASVITSGIV